MATSSSWSKLPGDILSFIARRLDSAVDLLRLRATCPAWRSSIPLPKPSPLPLTLPFYKATTDDLNPNGRPGSLRLFQSTIYRLDSPADDESDDNGWMFKVIETGAKKNCFSLLVPLKNDRISSRVGDDGNGSLPRGINLLDYRVVEVCKSYSLKFVDRDDESNLSESVLIRRVVVLGDWDAEIVVFLLREFGSLQAWRKGDAEWTMIRGEGKGGDWRLKYDDALCWNGKCYTVNVAGEVVVFDEELRRVMRIENSMVYAPLMQRKYLVVWKGELYMVEKTSDPDPEDRYDYIMDAYVMDVDSFDRPLKLVILKLNQRGDWEHVDRLGEGAFFVGDDVSFGVRARDFSGCKANCVYLTDECFWDEGKGSAYGDDAGVYDPDGNTFVALAEFPEYARMFWPPPSWLV
ncbi:hypothetical protein Droror1_Dr00004711 [Drosera rotundifolia]